jgi:hypothetical protein
MHRRTLILRRFGAVSFGLGYFDAGAWVDHTALPGCGHDLEIAGVADAADRPAVHAMLGCCDVATIPITAGRRAVVRAANDHPALRAAYEDRDTDVDAVARRTSAL